MLRLLPEHRNIPRLYGHYSTKRKAALVLEYLPFPNIKEFIESKGVLSEAEAVGILRQLVRSSSPGISLRPLRPIFFWLPLVPGVSPLSQCFMIR